MVAADTDGTFVLVGLDDTFRRCLNAAWGCNWLVRIGDDDAWCRSCEMTTWRWDDDNELPHVGWVTVENAKRRIMALLDELGLVTRPHPAAAPDGLMFHVTGHANEHGGCHRAHFAVAIDVVGSDRRDCGRMGPWADRQPPIDAIENLRHQLGHHYWQRLVGSTDQLDRFRLLFGTERDTDRSADLFPPRPSGPTCHGDTDAHSMTGQPLEAWAETFAQYLDIADISIEPDEDTGHLDLVEMPHPFGMTNHDRGRRDPLRWPPSTGALVERLAFVHHQIKTHAMARDLHIANVTDDSVRP
jgi:hypothetical protein